MGFLDLLVVASMPMLQVLLIGSLGAFLASGYANMLSPDARKHINKVVFAVFTPALIFASLAQTVTLQDVISWWFMPVNIGIIFLIGSILGWIVVKILKPERHLEGLIIATCSAGNLGNLMIIIVPAICNEEGGPFGEPGLCRSLGTSYASFSMALGGFFIWTHTYGLMRKAGALHKKIQMIDDEGVPNKTPNKDMDANGKSYLLKMDGEEAEKDEEALLPPSTNESINGAAQDPTMVQYSSSLGELSEKKKSLWGKLKGSLLKIVEELLAPPTVGAIMGFIVGAIPWLKSLIIGASAPLRVIQDSIKLLGDGTIPCITLILGGNLTQGIRTSRLKPLVILAVVCVRYVILPVTGIAVVIAASRLGFLPADPLYQYALMIQFTLPPAMNIGTMAELFDVAQEECSVLFLWTYLVAAFALTVWSTVYLTILS